MLMIKSSVKRWQWLCFKKPLDRVVIFVTVVALTIAVVVIVDVVHTLLLLLLSICPFSMHIEQ